MEQFPEQLPTAVRKGARTRAAVTPEVLTALNRGEIESRSLPEVLVLDFGALLGSVSPQASAEAHRFEGLSVTRRMSLAGELLLSHHGANSFDHWARHGSDTVRGWAAYLLAAAPKMPLRMRLARIRSLADDPHFGVREWAWLAMRPRIAADLNAAIALLEPWTQHASPNLRRFAVEITRPRGVWCSHLAALKEAPQLGLPLLENVKADPHKYVQDSCANWLNDAGKSQPQFVKRLTARWKKESRSPATVRICQRALRNLH